MRYLCTPDDDDFDSNDADPGDQDNDQQENDQHLKHKQDILAQPLEQAVHVQVFDTLFPQESTWHLQRLTLQLQEI